MATINFPLKAENLTWIEVDSATCGFCDQHLFRTDCMPDLFCKNEKCRLYPSFAECVEGLFYEYKRHAAHKHLPHTKYAESVKRVMPHSIVA
jgi:hypothetical protein